MNTEEYTQALNKEEHETYDVRYYQECIAKLCPDDFAYNNDGTIEIKRINLPALYDAYLSISTQNKEALDQAIVTILCDEDALCIDSEKKHIQKFNMNSKEEFIKDVAYKFAASDVMWSNNLAFELRDGLMNDILQQPVSKECIRDVRAFYFSGPWDKTQETDQAFVTSLSEVLGRDNQHLQKIISTFHSYKAVSQKVLDGNITIREFLDTKIPSRYKTFENVDWKSHIDTILNNELLPVLLTEKQRGYLGYGHPNSNYESYRYIGDEEVQSCLKEIVPGFTHLCIQCPKMIQ